MTNRFTINSAHQSFNDKQKALFDQLETAEQSTASNKYASSKFEEPMQEDRKEGADDRNEGSRPRRECGTVKDRTTRHYKKRESIFKRPNAPISRCLPVGRTPDFRKNPHKWTKYTLEDVEEMSDRSNKHAALSFLKSLEQDKSAEPDEASMETGLPTKIVFHKSSLLKRNREASKDDEGSQGGSSEEKATFRSSKVVMPEYVVGQSLKKEKKKKIVDRENGGENSQKQLKLDHLDEFEEDL